LKLHYDLQAAVYTMGVHAFFGAYLPFCFIAVETEGPHGVWMHETSRGTKFFENGMAKFRFAIRRLKECRELNQWPAYYGAYTVMDDIPVYAQFVDPDAEANV
jgi:hypothetical protein